MPRRNFLFLHHVAFELETTKFNNSNESLQLNTVLCKIKIYKK